MAFVFKSERNLDPHETLSLGPGSYLPQDKHTTKQSKAPFLSTSPRETSKPFLSSSTPGPGTYSEQPVEVELDGFGQTKFSPPFASQNTRFKEKNSSFSPGPGAYNVETSWKKLKYSNKVTIADLNHPSVKLSSLAPSIPSTHQFQGYEVDENGNLSIGQKNINGHSGEKLDSAGPGEYNIKNSLGKGGTNFHKSFKERDYTKAAQTTGPLVGPGTYTTERIKVEELYKYKNTSVFADKSKKGLNYVTISPGPGTYESKFSAFSSKKKIKKLQNFGSNTERFQHKLDLNTLGPGHYDNLDDNNSLSHSKVPFVSLSPRFTEKKGSNPGPGFYIFEEFPAKNKANKGKGGFGSTEKRFLSKNSESSPGPGYYKVAKKSKKTGPSAVFVSTTARTEIIHKANSPPPGFYDVQIETGNRRFPVLSQNLGKSTNMKYAFSSSTTRFDVLAKNTETPGPGSYDWKVKKKLGKVIVSDQNRFNYNSETNERDFYVEDGNWYKRSYNVLF